MSRCAAIPSRPSLRARCLRVERSERVLVMFPTRTLAMRLSARGVVPFVNVHARSSGRRRKSRMKICTQCKTPKEEKEFNKRVRAASGLCPQCRECNKRYDRDNRERFKRKRQNQWYRRTYGCTIDEFEAIVANQKGLCAVCEKRMIEPHLDHNHETGALRKALCHHCNVGLGHFNDNAELLRKAAKYLEDCDEQYGRSKHCSVGRAEGTS